jgi:hypothetical protein
LGFFGLKALAARGGPRIVEGPAGGAPEWGELTDFILPGSRSERRSNAARRELTG